MTGYRGSRTRAHVPVGNAVNRKIGAVSRPPDIPAQPGPFGLESGALSAGDRAAAAQWIAGVRKRQSTYRARMAAPRRPTPKISAGSQRQTSSEWEVLKAGGRGVIDSLPFDLGDYAPSAVSAIAAGALGHDPLAAFHRQLERERGQNRYDEAVHPTARTAGKVAGTVAQLAVPGMAWSRLVSARRMAQAAPILLKESGALAGVGAAAGVGMQVADDVIQQRRSSFPDYMGSGIGGGVGALTAIYRGPGYAGGVTGGTTSLAQDLLKGRVRSTADMSAAIDRAADAAAADNLFSLPVGAAIARGVNGLSVKKKGKLGEFLSIQRSRLRGKKVEGTHIKMPVKGGYTVADHVEKNGDIVEAKFGYSHRGLSRRQKQASHQFRNYRVDHLTPRDVAVASEVPIGFLSHQIYDDDR